MSTSQERWDSFRRRPEMYLGARSMDLLEAYLNGYAYAVAVYGFDCRDDPAFVETRRFSHWVAYRLRFGGSCSGWSHMIRERTGSENEAFELFFSLHDEYRARQPHIVAKIENVERTYSREYYDSDGTRTRTTHPYPRRFSFITYTSDPGFFVEADDDPKFYLNGFYPDLDYVRSHFGFTREQLTILDPSWTFANDEAKTSVRNDESSLTDN